MFGNGFKKYEKMGRSGKPTISISPSSWMTFNAALYKKHNLSIYTHCELFYNSNALEIGIRFIDDSEQKDNKANMIKMRKRTSKATGLESADINIRSFLNYYEAPDIEKATAYEAHPVREGDDFGLLVKLKEGKIKGKKEGVSTSGQQNIF